VETLTVCCLFTYITAQRALTDIIITNRLYDTHTVWCSGNALVSINAVALHRARLVLGWVTAFGQVNCMSHYVTSHPGQLSLSSFRGR